MGVNPELPGVNFYVTTCIHGVDLRFTPRCYLCKPWPTDSPVYQFVPGHVHVGEWCQSCVDHGWAEGFAQALDDVARQAEGSSYLPLTELARLRRIETVARALLTGSGDEELPDEEWDPMYLDLRAALPTPDSTGARE